MEITAQTPSQVDALYQQYLTLTPAEQSLLKILAVVYKPIGISKLQSLLTLAENAGLEKFGNKADFISAEKRKELIKQDFISQNRDGIKLNLLLANKLTQDCIKQNSFNLILSLAEQIVPVTSGYSWQFQADNEQRLLRDFYYLHELKNFEQMFDFNKNPQIINRHKNQILIELLFIPFNLTQFLKLSNILQYQAFAAWFKNRQMQGKSNQYPLELLETVYRHNPNNIQLMHLLSEQYLLMAKFDDYQRVKAKVDGSCYGLQLEASYLFLQGEIALSVQYFEQAIAIKNRYVRRKKQYLGDIFGYFYKLALCIKGSQQNIASLNTALDQINFEQSDRSSPQDFYQLTLAMTWGIHSLSSGTEYDFEADRFEMIKAPLELSYQLINLNAALHQLWCNDKLSPNIQQTLTESLAFFKQTQLDLFVLICQQMLAMPEINFHQTLLHLPSQVSRKAEWDLALDKLLALQNDSSAKPQHKTSDKPTRLIWEIEQVYSGIHLKPKEQKQSGNGWTKGRAIALKRLHDNPQIFDYLSEQDLAICQHINAYQSWGYYSKTEYALETASALKAAVGAPNLYLAGQLDAPIDLIEKEPELLVNQQGEQLCLSIANLPDYTDENDLPYAFNETSPGVYTFTQFNKSHIQVAEIIGEEGLLIPVSAKQKALKSISAIAPLLNIQSDINELDTGLETIKADQHLVINIQPLADGLEFNCVVMPFGEQGPAIKPAIGNVNLTTEINGKRIATVRDLAAEQDLLDQLDRHCPQFLAMSDTVLRQDDNQSALETLEQLEQVINQQPIPFLLKLRWPKGKKIKLSSQLKSEHLQLAVNKKSEWFDMSGELKVNNEEVIELKKLLALVSSSNGRFIQLDSDKILNLSQDLRARLEQLSQITEQGQFHPLASLQVEEAIQGMRLKTIHAWDEQTQKMAESNQIEPKIPSTLQADLREYQQQGFDWMSRLAHWGAGACLADDMGLGKTLQALALLVSRAPNGAALIIAPTSVCFNWMQEATKFAPTLNFKLFADSATGEQRTELINNLNPFDCIVISYGLLQREADLLSQIRWHTIVADEAQALKNPLAKRTKAAFKLKANFKLVTTGTPIENDLTELWSLFKFVNPGLLGNLKEFGKRFALPIANAKEDKLAARKAQNGLRQLIKPFILRRMKNQVLTELPARTEINIPIELSEKEQAFYEALRLNAIDNISAASQDSSNGEQRIKMLAELTKLRQACCNPALIMAETDLPSAKLQALDILLDELKQNNHKALIFSQFVSHLQLIKQHLDKKGISYQYLDGSTPQKARQKSVNDFQAGSGDVFLISLKAGGFGLNLTAADYVIHMDPWWNPAVEDQASDRAHRMGQQRPVTIYRLIAQNTIEEKILSLHQQKRDLADKLLAGSDTAQKLSVDDMLILLKDTF
ncbi:DEAD/DEAH box helicase [Catenovulum sp. 2E275]|uniref:DEAD/DEAH box helicase n=1 Tax=Catenovulum sp. 2E275 TaxID=2980497 RepID=UPI0021CE406F|nr:DEAD/DEAH box helicase [Catenovulum sp. 2E275]MCU4675215.1 DEAD/DEAH box helicase [Catenovulum sp. 2E275]